MGSYGIGDPSKDPSNTPITRFDVVPPEAQLQDLPGANLCKHVYLAPTSSHGPVCYPIAKASHLGQPTGTNPKFFVLPGADWCITTINSSLTRRHVPKALLPFFCPTKPPISELSNPCMASVQASDHAPHQIKFDTDSQKFLIDSGASAHIGIDARISSLTMFFPVRKERTTKYWG